MTANFLVIEDHPENRRLIVYLLEQFGHRVRTAATGEEGLEIALSETFDLIICDIHLPGMDGYELASRLKKNPHWHRVPLIAVTALAMAGDCDKVLRAGFDVYLSKPITPHTFTRQIESFLPNTTSQSSNPAEAVTSQSPKMEPRTSE